MEIPCGLHCGMPLTKVALATTTLSRTLPECSICFFVKDLCTRLGEEHTDSLGLDVGPVMPVLYLLL